MTPTHIVLHHSLTKDSGTVSWGAIRRYHTKDLGWRDIGYHFGIEMVNDSCEILLGRMPYETGAHCTQQGMNNTSLGICFVGNFDIEKPSDIMWKKGLDLCSVLCKAFKVPVDNIHGHNYYAPYKSCPGKLFNVERFKKDLQFMIFKP